MERVIARVESGSEACDSRIIVTSAANQLRLFLHAGALAPATPRFLDGRTRKNPANA